jgi:hypothetical protein
MHFVRAEREEGDAILGDVQWNASASLRGVAEVGHPMSRCHRRNSRDWRQGSYLIIRRHYA